MTENKATRLSKIAKEFNVGISTIVDFLNGKGISIDTNPNTKISPEHYGMLQKEFSSDLSLKKESEKLNLRQISETKKSVSINDIDEENGIKDTDDDDELIIQDSNIGNNVYETEKEIESSIKFKVVGKINLEAKKASEEKTEKEKKEKTIVAKLPEAEKQPEPKDTVDKQEKETAKEPVAEQIPEPTAIEEKAESEEKEELKEPVTEQKKEERNLKVLGKIDLDSLNQKTRPDKKKRKEAPNKEKTKHIEAEKRENPEIKEPVHKKEEPKPEKKVEDQVLKIENLEEKEIEVIKAKVKKLNGPTVIGKIDLPVKEKKKPTKKQVDKRFDAAADRKKKRKRIRKETEKVDVDNSKQQQPKSVKPNQDNKKVGNKENFNKNRKKPRHKTHEIKEEDIQKQVKDTLARLTSKGKSKGSKYRRDKRDVASQRAQEAIDKKEAEKNMLKVTEFVSVSELSSLMSVQVNEIIATCMNLGLIVSINQRLDAETMSILAEEYGYELDFVSAEVQDSIVEEADLPENLSDRSPIVTVMGHVDHGKTKLLDYIRSANVVDGEAGGITQHIGAYRVKVGDNKRITFLDTPGHEAFTAMRARGAQLTDVTIIVVAADDGVMPQTEEAINHAQAAGVPMIFAINKIDKPTANPDKVKEELANKNILVEDWGGKYQSQEVSAKSGLHIDDLLEKVLLEAELLELKANPNRPASGAIIESSLDKGRGYVATVLVQNGTLHIGDIMLSGEHFGRVKAMYNEHGKAVKEAGPSTPVLVLGLDGAPQAGDKFNIMKTEREAREVANKRNQLQREQGLRTNKHITLDEIGRRIAIGNFQELNIIVKGDVDGSVEALSDSLLKLSTEEIQVNIISKAVGQISEADVYLAAASNAIILGFQVRPSLSAKKLAEKEEIDIRLYSIIYDAIEEIRAAMEGMLSPEIKEEIVANLEILETFKITKVGTIAGCMVREGKIKRSSKVRIIRDGIVIYSGNLGSLKRFKDEVKEVVTGLECGLNIENFNDIKVGDVVEAYEEFEVKKKL